MLRAMRGAVICALASACTSREPPLRIGTTYTVEQSGALALLDSLWAGNPPAVVVAPSGQILRAAAQADLDVVITHAPALEARWLGGGSILVRCPFVTSRFALVGPATDPARVADVASAAEAFGRIARAARPFVSRGDSSGTHEKELALWEAAAEHPRGRSWYIESGADQAATLRLADERDAYALADLPTFAKLTGLRLRILFTADPALLNPYTLYVVRGGGPAPAARAFAAWALGPWREHLLDLRLPDGTPAFEPGTGECSPPAERDPEEAL